MQAFKEAVRWSFPATAHSVVDKHARLDVYASLHKYMKKTQTLVRLVALAIGIGGHALAQDQSQDQARELDQAIEKYRQGTLTIEAAPGTAVIVEQLRHEFWFGAALANQAFDGRMPSGDREKYLKIFLTNFNAAVTENALKWHSMEQQRGRVNYDTVDAILSWTDQNHIPLRGHNIFWGVPDQVQSWIKALPDDELREVLKNRALDVGSRYRGRFAEYDLNNEMIHGNYYEQRLGPDITLQMANWVRQGDSNAVLFLNDYDILTGARVDDYVKQIRTLLNQGVPIGGIGVQGHVHAETFDAKAVRNALDKLAEFKLPIRVTEFNMPGQKSRFYKERNLRLTDAQEKAKAQALVDYYRICFAQPRVEGILMWGFWEGANWIPVSSLYNRDWTSTPAAEAYRDLVYHQWWTQCHGQTDVQGRYKVRAFFGQYRIKAGAQEVVTDLRKTAGAKTVSIN
jgi:endo-1,4-beta-xylanase